MQEPSPQLLARCRQGDTQAFAQLVAQQQAYVYNLAYRFLGDAEEARDLVQEALLRAWQMLPSFRGEARFTTWLYRLIVNLGMNRLAHLRRRPQEVDLDQYHSADSSALAMDPQKIHTTNERRALIWKQVDALPDKYRLVITLFYQQERSYEEIAAISGLPLNTVKTHLSRARHMLASQLMSLKGDQDEL